MSALDRLGLARGKLLLVAALAACAACGGAGDRDHAAHEHADGDAHASEDVVKSDAHHVAEARPHCDEDVVLPPGALARYGIRVEAVRETRLVPTVDAPGHLVFPQGAVARVGSPVTGRVVDVRVKSGDSVERGDVLLVVESPELGEAQSAYLQKRTLAASAGPSLEVALAALERARELHERVQGISLAEVQRREAEVALARRERDLARAEESAARDRLRLLGMDDAAIAALLERAAIAPRLEIAAPARGRVVELSATLGELVGPAKDRLLVIGDARTLWAIAEVSESRLAEVALGARARVRVPALAGRALDGGALRNAPREGTVAAVPTVLEASTRSAEVRIEVANEDGALLPGMFLQVEIESTRGAGRPVLAVPDGAVLEIDGSPSVFVPLDAASNTFCKHEVEIGEPIGGRLPVLAGLAAGELVVVSGTFRLKAELGKSAARHEH